ncbi:CHRD domain-containing protein [Actinoallomurus sp. CA-150999]|uniref:CHRD domain-containing protein n=1 Tax=Actinoallomurus sp. CA-150999 TaxID=3239887 RepID=UPI003D9320D7
MFSKRLIIPGVLLTAGTVVSAGAYAYASSTGSDTSGEAPVYLVASLQGRNEVPGTKGPVGGDRDGQAVEVLRIKGDKVSYTVRWKGITAPTEGHVHAGAAGVNGAVKIELFDKPRSGHVAHGTVKVRDKKLLAALRTDPGSFYTNLHTAQFPGGAVRGQFHKIAHPVNMKRPAVTSASVVRGAQIYACTRQADGTYAFTQHDVAALLDGGIRHSFVRPDAGPPQWIAPDGSAVTGKVVTKTANGQDNIPELDLTATQAGRPGGLLSRTGEVLRLNTVGGTAPKGTCDPGRTPIAQTPYRADYLFIG